MAARHNLAVLCVHHLRKAGADDSLDHISGSTGLSHRGMSEENERPRFNPQRFSLAFFVFSAASVVVPEYAGLVVPWRWIVYAIGFVSFLFGCLGTLVEVGGVYGGTAGFRMSVYLLVWPP